MKCDHHQDIDALTACARCGELVCPSCRVLLNGDSYCNACGNEIPHASTKDRMPSLRLVVAGMLGALSGVLSIISAVSLLKSSLTLVNPKSDDMWTGPHLAIPYMVLSAAATLCSLLMLRYRSLSWAITAGLLGFMASAATTSMALLPALASIVLMFLSRRELSDSTP